MKEDFRILVELLRQLTPGDRSVLQAAAQTPDSQIATVENSQNDQFWSRLVEFGLAEEMTLDVDIPPALSDLRPKSFRLTVAGREVVPDLLKRA
jgi:hypothetical protein